ncbi:hypothetical protein BC567DRAFT_285089 [Phyllosticta citribraziliensis]
MQVPPALSNFLTSSYQQYKEDTNTVASWLATTARSCGYPEDLLLHRNTANAQKSGTQTTGRLKGKARKEAKQAASAAGAAANGASRRPAYVIAIKDFISLADFIAAKTNPRVKVPSYFAKTLDRAISTRKKHGTVAAAQAASEHSKENHSFFVGILERVQEVLAPILPPESTTEERKTADRPVDRIFNSFEALNVEEPSQEFLNAPDVVFPERPLPDFEAEQLDDIYERATLLSLLLDDMLVIRQVVNNLWVGYKYGYYDIIAISLATNTAIDFMRALENDMPASMEKHGGVAHHLEALAMGHHYVYGVDIREPVESKYNKNPPFYNMEEEVMLNAFFFLKQFAEDARSRPHHIPMLQAGLRDRHYDPTSSRHSKTPGQKYMEDSALIEDFFSFATLHVRAAFPDEATPEDELIRGFRIVLKTGKIRFWNVLAVQLFLDVHHLLRQDVIRPYNELCEAAQEIESTMKETIEFYKEIGLKPWSAKADETMDILMGEIESSTRTDYKLQAHFHELGVNFAGSRNATTSVCHLYHAVRLEKLLDKPWKDLETFIELQGETLFGEKAPETLDQCCRRFFITHGVSAASLAKDSRRYFRSSKAGVKPLPHQAPLALIFIDRFCRNSYRHEFTPDELRNIMEKTIMWSHDDNEEEGIKPWQVTFGMRLSRPTRNQARRQAQDFKKTKSLQRLPIAGLLKKMCNALQGEMFEMTFNYFRMHIQCWKVLQSIKEESHDVLSTMTCFNLLDKAAQLPYVAGMVFFSTMRTSNLFLAKMASTRNTHGAAPILFVDTANVIEALIDRGEGDVVTGPQVEEEEDTDDDDDDEPMTKAEIPLNPNPIWRSQYEIQLAEERAQEVAKIYANRKNG